jgi:Flp pilus assembly protein protease CpaA
MKSTLKVICIALATIFALSAAACSGGKSINSPEALKEYLDSRPANSPDKPIKVSMSVNDQTLKEIAEVIVYADRYVSLNLSGNALTSFPYGAFMDCANLTSVTIPNSVTNIGDSAFFGCNSLTSVTIPNSVTSIGEFAFAGCDSLANVTIPNGVINIGSFAFPFCASLASVTFQGTIPSSGFDSSAFNGLGDLREKYLANGIGTYTRPGGGTEWTKK